MLEGLGGCPAVDQVLSKCSEGLGRSNVDTTLGDSFQVLKGLGVQRSTRFLRSARVSGGRPGSFEVLEGLGPWGVDTKLGEFPSKCSKDWVSGGRPGSFEVLEGLGPWGVDTTLGEFPSKCSKDRVGVRRLVLEGLGRSNVDGSMCLNHPDLVQKYPTHLASSVMVRIV